MFNLEEAYMLKEAIRYGFIEKSIDPYGTVRYSLTNKGLIQWISEKVKSGITF